MEFFVIFLVSYIALENPLPFQGLLSTEMSESVKALAFKDYMVAWLPSWWIVLAGSFMSAGMGFGCAIWAFVEQSQGQPVGIPVLIGGASLITAFAGLVVPITLAWFKDRSEQRQQENLRVRVRELELQVEVNRQGHVDNAVNIQKVTVATQKIADAAEKIVEQKNRKNDLSRESSWNNLNENE